MAIKQFDVVIVGGGMVGASQAVALHHQFPSLSIAIIEPVPQSAAFQPSYDGRSVALAWGSCQILDKYGIWSGLSQYAEPISSIHVSDRGHFGKARLSASEYQVPALGYVVEVVYIGKVLHERLNKADNVTWFCPNKLTAIEPINDGNRLTLDSGEQIDAALLIAADGGQSATRNMLNIRTSASPYPQHAIIANVSVADGHENKAFERFTTHGPVALLPLSDNRYSLVWCLPPDEIQATLALSDDAFLEALQHAFGYRAGQFVKTGQRFSYPLSLVRPAQLISHHALLCGNASHTVHPIAGQGFNLGIRDIEALVQLLKPAIAAGANPGEYSLLHQFSNHRLNDSGRVITMTDTLVKTFSNESRLLAFGRSLGLTAMDIIDCFKQPLAKQAMGLNTSFPNQ